MRATGIENGQRVQVKTPLYTGPAGVRQTDAGGDFSAPGAVPLAQYAPSGVVDGRAIRILGARPSAVDKSMMVVVFEWSEGE